MDIGAFFNEIIEIHDSGNVTEHSYRPALTKLFNSIFDKITAINEPQHITNVGAPDFSFHRGDVTIGHGEAKKLGIDLKAYIKKEGKEQFDRYRKALPNLLYTDGMTFLFYRDGKLRHEVSIGDDVSGWKPKTDQFEALRHALEDFASQRPQTIKTPAVLARLMAGKASLIKDILKNSLINDADHNTSLVGQYKAFKEQLIHDITPSEFADIYAETIAYGMFAARLHDTTLDTFSRQEALELLPKSNPFLRSLFSYVAGHELDDRIAWVIDDLADVFQACDVAKIMEKFGKLTGRKDPFIHFYEDFLGQYNPDKREARGVWYTPEPVVNFIVRAVDDVLKSDFGLPMGLADNSKITIDWDTGQADKKGKPVSIKKEVHRVQVLDPATGTGTFLAEVIKLIEPHIKQVAAGQWNHYVEKELIPRLHGFELLMASYAMCHMKIDMILTELGYKPTKAPPRLGVYLTNSLEEGERDVRDLFMAQWLSQESREANNIKTQQPIMCVIGNPPYSGISQNTGEWITNLIEDYKYVDGVHFGERKHWLHDDYVKFIRLAESLIEKNGEGVLGFITNHGYLDNPTFRGMRWHLLKTFDKIYILDLHGNSKKKEVCPDGSSDKNVFDIRQGVAVIIGVKTTPTTRPNKRKAGQGVGMAQVYHAECWGKRAEKYKALWEGGIKATEWIALENRAPQYAFVNRDYESAEQYGRGFILSKFMLVHSTGVVTSRDSFIIDESDAILEMRVREFTNKSVTDAQFLAKFPLKENSAWKVSEQRLQTPEFSSENLKDIDYRLFDKRRIYYQDNLVFRRREAVFSHLLQGENISLCTTRMTADSFGCFLSKHIISNKFSSRYDQSYSFPLYLYPDEQDCNQSRRVNFCPTLYKKLQNLAKHPDRSVPDEVQVFDYIYGVLHCPAYRETYAEFLKIDFPRIPWPKTPEEFWSVSEKGTQLRRLHLMEPDAIGETPYPFDGDGNSIVDKPSYKDGRVWINKTQSFDNVPQVAWEFYIGGYQPAQKWLKDRKGRDLSFDDIMHYQKIIKILSETDRIMKTIKMNLT